MLGLCGEVFCVPWAIGTNPKDFTLRAKPLAGAEPNLG